MSFKYHSPRSLTSCVGEVSTSRRYRRCTDCGHGEADWDRWAGVGSGHLSFEARRLAALAGSDHSFDKASQRLWQMCGLKISDQTVRRACEAAGQEAQAYVEQSEEAARAVQKAKGQFECVMDGTSVNTTEGWREIRAVVISKREAGKPADLRHWADRHLPDAQAKWCWAKIADHQVVGEQVRVMADRLGLGRGRGVSSINDGAKWIWKQMNQHLPDHESVLDVYHMLEHLHEAGRVLHDGEAARAWSEHQRAALFRLGGYRYLKEELLPHYKTRRQVAPNGMQTQALRALFVYLWANRGRMRYRDRLKRGLPIGSGQIEGACKNMLKHRLCKNSPRWRLENADRMAALCCLHYSDQWNGFWKQASPPP